MRRVWLTSVLVLWAVQSFAQSSVFRAVQSGDMATLRTTPAYYLRTYLHGARGALREHCSNLSIPRLPGAAEVLAYTVTPAGKGTDKVMYAAVEAGNYLTFTKVTADPALDLEAHVAVVGCDASRHRDFIDSTTRLLSNDLVAGSITSSVVNACLEAITDRGIYASACQCLATGVDMTATPAHREQLQRADLMTELQRLLREDGDFAARATYKCTTAPRFKQAVTAGQLTKSVRHGVTAWYVSVGRPMPESQSEKDRALRDLQSVSRMHVLTCHYSPNEQVSFWHERVGISERELRAASQRHPLLQLRPMVRVTCPATHAEALADTTGQSGNPSDDPIVGIYRVQGSDRYGRAYNGTCAIEKLDGDRYRLSWQFGSGKASYTGIGAIEGDTLTVEYGTPANRIVYKIFSNGTLAGKYDGNAVEQLIPRR